MTYVVTEACIKCKYTDCVEVCPAWPWTGTWVAQITPAPISVIPITITGLGPIRVTSSCERPATISVKNGSASPRSWQWKCSGS